MKKVIVFFLTVLMFSGSAWAVNYRGFAEISYGKAFEKATDWWGNYELENSNAFGFSTTHGAQLNRHMFVGGGVDVCVFTGDIDHDNSVNLNIFGNFRYDMDITKKCSPFFSLKVGYRALPASVFGELISNEGEVIGGYATAKYSPLYVNPSIGVRFRLSSKCGLNVGVGYTPLMLKTDGLSGFYEIYGSGGYEKIPYENAHVDIKTGHLITLNIGIDF
ncbi:MAG: hypothetical protein K2K92_01780 [Duncaniella sp.]|nr:hypothetical protein [Duncaniella sp.]